MSSVLLRVAQSCCRANNIKSIGTAAEERSASARSARDGQMAIVVNENNLSSKPTRKSTLNFKWNRFQASFFRLFKFSNVSARLLQNLSLSEMSCQSAHTGCSGAQAPATQQQHEETCSYALGPYPDEVIMLALDRILYYSGVTKIKHLLQMANFGTPSQLAPPASISTPPPTAPSAPCKVSCGTSTCNLIGKIDVSKYNSSNSSLSHFTSAKTGKSVKGLTPSLRSETVNVSNLHPRTPHVDFANPVVDNRLPAGPSISTSVKQSLSACSIACRRLKVKLSATAQNKDQRWVWTRLVSSANGCKVYEVYQNSKSDKKPWKSCDPKQQPVVVFLVMPSGHVMVFETVSRS